MRLLVSIVLVAMLALQAPAAQSRMLTIVGYLEDAVIQPAGLPIKAKMDTGANSASINAVDIERYRNNGEDWVRFTVDTGERRMNFRLPVEEIVRIRRAGTTVVERPVVRLGLCIAGRYRLARVNLADRSRMSFPLLVGRSFMESTGLVIDAGQKYVGKPLCAEAP